MEPIPDSTRLCSNDKQRAIPQENKQAQNNNKKRINKHFQKMCFALDNTFTYLKSFTWSPVATEPHTTAGWFGQLIHIKARTVSNSDVLRPMTAARRPMETHFARHSSLIHCRVSTSQITGRMRTTIIFRHTIIRHLVARSSLETIPLFS